MFSIKNNIIYFIVFNVLVQVQSLVEIPAGEDNDIVITEAAVRNTVNSIFFSLKLKRVKRKAKFKEFAAIHNFFTTITLQDYDNLNKISRLAKVNNIDNDTQDLITLVNEVLNEGNKSYEATDDVYVTTHIKTFIEKLEYLKHKYGFRNNAGGFDINSEIINHLSPGNSFVQNVTKAVNKTNDLETNENLLSDDEYWRPGTRRIYEGHRTNIKRFPFMASVLFFNKFQCAGSIIKSDLVITSASCLQLAWNNRFFRENPAFLSVHVGSEFYEGGPENIAVLEVYFHPGYNPKNLRNNIAIMRLTRRLNFGKKVRRVKKIDFDRNPWPLPQTTPGITIIGWGARSISNVIRDPWSNRLSYAELDFYPLEECREIYSKEYVAFSNFCAGFFSKGGGACNRDTGGPGVSHGILIGVVSFGSPSCGTPDAPTVFTKLGYYTDWIEGIMEQAVPISKGRTTVKTKMFTYDFQSINKATSLSLQPITFPPSSLEEPPITDEPLRKLDENLIFKEFIKTMFGSEEAKEYLEEYEIEKTAEEKSSAAVKEIMRDNVSPTTVPTTKVNVEIQIPANYIDTDSSMEQGRTVNMVTTTENFESSKKVNTKPNVLMKYTVLDPEMENDKQLRQNITELINDIDIQKLLESDSSEPNSSNNEKGTTRKPVKKRKSPFTKSDFSDDATTPNPPKKSKSASNKPETLKEKPLILNASDEDDYSSVDKDLNQLDQLIGLLDKVNDKKDEHIEGQSIQAKSSTQNTSEILNMFSNGDLMILLNDAVADATKNNE